MDSCRSRGDSGSEGVETGAGETNRRRKQAQDTHPKNVRLIRQALPTNRTDKSAGSPQTSAMTQARRQLVDPNHAQMFHCTARCVRRAWLCGIDRYTNLSFEHRKHWVEDRILKLADVFACGIYAFAIMSNHYHMVLHMHPPTANSWTDLEVAQRWTKLYPTATAAETASKIEAIVANPELVKIYRTRLSDLSWLIKSVSEPIARRANDEDQVLGRFWEG
jgi:hypothetical protein